MVEDVGEEEDHRGDRGRLVAVAPGGQGGDQRGEEEQDQDVPPAARDRRQDRRRDDQAHHRAEGAQQGPGEDRAEVGLHDEGDGQGDPVGAGHGDRGDEDLGEADADGETEAVTPGAGGQEDVAGGPGGADAEGGRAAEAVVDASRVHVRGRHHLGRVAQGVVDRAGGLAGGGGEVEAYRAGVAGLHGVGEVADRVADLWGERLAGLVDGGGRLDHRGDGVQLGQQAGEFGAAAVVAGAPGEDEVVRLVQGLGDGLAGRVVAGRGVVAAGREEVGDGAVGVGDRRPFRDPGAQRPGQQGEEEDEEAAAGHQDGCHPPGAGERQARADHRVEEQQQSRYGSHRADRRDHPGDQRDAGERGHRPPAVAVGRRAEGDADRAEELGDRDVEDAHPVRVGGVADDAGEGAHGGEGAVGGLSDGQADGEGEGHRDGGAGDGRPVEGGLLGLEVPHQPVGGCEADGELAGHTPIMGGPSAYSCW